MTFFTIAKVINYKWWEENVASLCKKMCLLLHECEEGCEKGLSLCSITIFQIRFEKNFILKKKKKKEAPVQFYFKK